ncbi:hypothetical protein ABKV19_022116 [Rosa sericea]
MSCLHGDSKSYDRDHFQTEAGFLLPTFQSPMAAKMFQWVWTRNRNSGEEGDAVENQRKKDKKKLEVEKSKKMGFK